MDLAAALEVWYEALLESGGHSPPNLICCCCCLLVCVCVFVGMAQDMLVHLYWDRHNALPALCGHHGRDLLRQTQQAGCCHHPG